MSNKEIQPLEGEIVEPQNTSIAPKQGGVFIGTLNIMTEPARNFLTEPLADIYKDRYHGKFKNPKHVFAFDLGLIALGAALAAVSIYFGLIYKPFEPVTANIELMPKTPVSGSEVVINLNVSNMGQDPITDVVAAFKLPPELKFKRSSSPYQRNNNTVNLDSIAPGADAIERIVADLSGPVGRNIKISANISYKDNKTGKNLTKNAAANMKIAVSSVGAELELPENAIAGQEFSGSIRYFNHGNTAIDNVVIIPVWPQNFTLSSSVPAAKNNIWTVGTLRPDSAGQINFRGAIGGDIESAEFSIETGVKSGADILSQAQSNKTVNVTNPRVTVNLNGDAEGTLGNRILLTATYKNSGDQSIDAAAIKAVAEPGITISGIDPLPSTQIKPGESGMVKIYANIDPKLKTDNKNPVDPQLTIRATLSGKLNNDEDITISSPAWVIKIGSEIGLSSGAHYYSDAGDQLGRGPLPPEVGKTTRYWIFWNIKNTTGAVSDLQVTGKLPANVSFTGKASVPFGDAPIYDPGSRTITWNIDKIPAWPGVTSPAIGAAIEVAFTPTPNERNTYGTLMTDQQITGTDSVTGIKLSNAAIPNITSHLTTDPQASGTGQIK